MSERLRCEGCGASVVWDAGHDGAACLFCARVSLRVEARSEAAPVPELRLPARVSAAGAEARFRAWTSASWFRPRALREVAFGLRLLWLPAWRVDATLETHWAGLERARARKSGKRAVAGVEVGRLGVMVAASEALTQAELSALQPFDERDAEPWTESSAGPWEPPGLSRRGAMSQGGELLAERHRVQIQRARGLLHVRVSPRVEVAALRLSMLPIYIGTFRYRDRAWRVLINAQTGAVVGEAPVDWRKVAALAAVAAAIGLLAWLTA